MKTFAICLTIALTSSVSIAHAQSPQSLMQRPRVPAGYGVPNHGYHFGPPCAGGVHHAATAAEAQRRGMAAVIQAQAEYNLLTSLAALNAAEAKRMQMENRQQRLESYYAARQINRELRAADATTAHNGKGNIAQKQTAKVQPRLAQVEKFAQN